jgi:hypothetical protein
MSVMPYQLIATPVIDAEPKDTTPQTAPPKPSTIRSRPFT